MTSQQMGLGGMKHAGEAREPPLHVIQNLPYLFCDPGAIRTPNQQNRNLSFYPLNYGTVLIKQKYNQMRVFTTYSLKLHVPAIYCNSSITIFAKVFLFSQT